ncbi:MAG TPA: 50S ribosomal protein L6 [Nitrospirae bacterium]|nr:50S ribosomal protein L6 [bacterium BMS3Abin06]HDH13330.1 50S ribosomal protein L6 [Nitrospirota bacterium]HDZ00332.1 50S ribosomal protein L6 [Nitrospirota bacterium]
MSRVGKNPINLPDGVDVKLQGDLITVKGPKGELKWNSPAGMKVSMQDKSIVVERPSDSKQFRSLHGTTRSIIANMVAGTSAGYRRVLEISGVGYRAQVQGRKISFTLGYSHPVEYQLPEGISAEVDKKQTLLTLQGIDKQLIGQVAANIRSLRSPNIYKGKGIRYSGEIIKLKVGKAGK